ncbi:hypothetical protein DP117_34895, partial [Brasilonema sp. UFV-L1]|nr:hypothetical protein [Brasilonema sp. UFV-L1]
MTLQGDAPAGSHPKGDRTPANICAMIDKYGQFKTGAALMQSALRIETKVLPGNKIEINLPADTALTSVGQTVEVIVLLPELTVLRCTSL